MSLASCRLCGKLYDNSKSANARGICLNCLNRLETLYSGIHEYIRTHDELKSLNVDYLAKVLRMKPDDIQLLLDMGYFERDIQTYSRLSTERQELASKFRSAIDRMNSQRKITTYGGLVYDRV